MRLDALDLCCPACEAVLVLNADSYHCQRCDRAFPVICGIPDLRIASDRYLTLEQERHKARLIAARAERATFAELLDYYYTITDDVPPALARTYKAAVFASVDHGAAIADDVTSFIAARPGSFVLDAGCGAGGLLIAASLRAVPIAGLDIALRWLIICRKRLTEAGFEVPLVCADIERPPFRRNTFDAVLAIDLIEHVPDVSLALGAIRDLTLPGGKVWLTAANGRTPGPHPTTRIWAIGLMPSAVRRRYLQRYRGIDTLRYSHLLSPLQVCRIARRIGFVKPALRSRRLAPPGNEYKPLDRALIRVYRTLSRLPLVAKVLALIGPSFELTMRRSEPDEPSVQHG